MSKRKRLDYLQAWVEFRSMIKNNYLVLFQMVQVAIAVFIMDVNDIE